MLGDIPRSLEFQAGNKAGSSTKLVRPGVWVMLLEPAVQAAMASALAGGSGASLLPSLSLFNPCLYGRKRSEFLSEVP